jgi:predicted kinase
VRRNQALKVARDTGARFLVLYLEAEEEILRSRLRERAGKVTITNGREEILADQMRAFIPPEDVPAGSVLIIDASGSHQEIIRSAYRRVLSTNG